MIGTAFAQLGSGTPPAFISFAPLVLVFVVFYFLLIRPQQQKAKEHRGMLDNLKKNDEIITSGGLYGRIAVLDKTVATLEIAPNVRVRIDRSKIESLAKTGRGEPKPKDEPTGRPGEVQSTQPAVGPLQRVLQMLGGGGQAKEKDK